MARYADGKIAKIGDQIHHRASETASTREVVFIWKKWVLLKPQCIENTPKFVHAKHFILKSRS